MKRRHVDAALAQEPAAPEPSRRLSAQATYLDAWGREMPDPTPVAPPVGYNRQPSLAEQIRAMVRSEQVRQAAEAAGLETFEEADDFDVGDDYDPASPYEEVFEPPVDPYDRLTEAFRRGVMPEIPAGVSEGAEPAEKPGAATPPPALPS